MKIKFYRYFVALEKLCSYTIDVTKETNKHYLLADGSFIGGQRRTKIAKEDNGISILKDRTCYPYIDFYSTENPSRDFAIENICKYFKNNMIGW